MLTLRRSRLVAQSALAIAACDWLSRAPAQAFSAADAPSCHEAPARNTNLCLAHCLSGDQSTDTPSAPVAAFAAVPALVVTPVSVLAIGRDVRAELPHPEPPPRIRFQTFRI